MIEILTSCLGLMLLGAVERRGAMDGSHFLLSPGNQVRSLFLRTCLLNATDFAGRSRKSLFLENG